MKSCMKCGSGAINPGRHGRDNTDLDLCDVCYWRTRAETSYKAGLERAAEIAWNYYREGPEAIDHVIREEAKKCP